MPFTRKVEIGAIALCNFGPDAGKLYAISDVLDLNYVRLKRPMGYFRLLESRRRVAGAGVRYARQNADGRRRRREFHCLLVSRTLRAILALRGRHAVSCALEGRPVGQASSCAGRSRFDVSHLVPAPVSPSPRPITPANPPARPSPTSQALVDRPDEIRRKMNFKRLIITDLKVDMPRLAKKSVLAKAMADADVEGKFASSSWGQKLARREAKKNMSDFDRHCAAVKKMKRSASVRKAFNKLKKSA